MTRARAITTILAVGCIWILTGCSSSDNADPFATSGGNGSNAGATGTGVNITAGGVTGGVGSGTAGTAGTAGSTGGTTGCSGSLVAVLRDFHASFPDMEVVSHDASKKYGDDRAIVTDTIGPDFKPVYAGNPDTPTTTGQVNFDQWYRDGMNDMSMDLALPFTAMGTGGVFGYDNQAFFPADGKLFNDVDNGGHNFHFTVELHTTFAYNGGEQFTFIGDDDVFTYINGHLAVNLGGVHTAETATVNLDAQAAALGITVGQTYQLDFFFAERHIVESHFHIDTTLAVKDCGFKVRVN